MARVRKTVTLHESTVQKAARITVHKRKRNPPKRLNSPVVVIQVLIWSDSVHELIVAWVEENKIDPSRIEIVSADEIVIHNPEVI